MMLRVIDGGSLPDYRAWLVARGLSPGTVRLRMHYAEAFDAATGDWLTATPDDVVAWLASHPAWGPETRKSARSSVAMLYRWGLMTGRCDHDPTLGVPPVRVPRAVPRPASEVALARALAVASTRDRLALLLAAQAGLRCAEIAAVHADDVQDGTLTVRGKGGRQRVIPLHPDLVPLLADVRGWAFPSPVRIGQHERPASISARLSGLLGPRWTAHQLRHRFATAALAGTMDLRAVQELLGHASVATTERYTAVTDPRLAAAVRCVPSAPALQAV